LIDYRNTVTVSFEVEKEPMTLGPKVLLESEILNTEYCDFS